MKLYHALVVESEGYVTCTRWFKTAKEAKVAMLGWMRDHIDEIPTDVPDWDLFTISDLLDPSYVWSGYIFELDTESQTGHCRYLSAADIEQLEDQQ